MIKKVMSYVYPHEPLNMDRIKELFDSALDNEEFTGIILVDPNDIPKGYIFAFVNDLYFHPVKVGTCLSIWVEEDCRGHSLDMIRAFEAWCRYKDVDSMVISEFAGLTPKNTERMFKRLGYRLQEKQYWKE